MLRKEHIRQAIEAISRRNPEIGYVLDEMLGTDRMHLASGDESNFAGEDLHFIFNDRPVNIKKVLFFDRGTVPIEERLLIKYGEMIMQHQLSQSGDRLDFKEAAEKTRNGGLSLLVDHEVDLAMHRLQAQIDTKGVDSKWAAGRLSRLRAIKEETGHLDVSGTAPCGRPDGEVLYTGTVDQGRPACFVRFPFTRDALMQAADINLEFFNIRFLLSCLIRGLEENLFACVVDNQIEGIVYLTFRKVYFYKAMEIQYIATAQGRPATEVMPGHKELKGIGSFLIAGVWMLWKHRRPDIKDLLLDSEAGARRFYSNAGFESRGFSGFIMKEPRGRLVWSIIEMAAHCPDLPNGLAAEVCRILKKQLRVLKKKPESEMEMQARESALECARSCLQAGINPAITQTLREFIEKNRLKIPEADEFITCMRGV